MSEAVGYLHAVMLYVDWAADDQSIQMHIFLSDNPSFFDTRPCETVI